ncbi:hypothetical protein FC753_04215 [Clostridium botulinum]|uniref:hypothetical protein n=1 Tax=Clostridium botulinum TaxID=1491 RepID=UPI0013F0D30C|nr:hypothetical protein [Clostridium botulinum]MCS6110729.1 hypothetical protein [Clostridium botulinum]NFE11259.1 hypothetical protein [Clostridium botulinum]NFO40085.1 hypothetical protein [Clostridium botulinum]
MAKGNREAFTLNEMNPKEKVVFDFLQTQYNKSQVIKDILYDYILSNDLQINTQSIQNKHVINTTKCIQDVSNVYKDLQQDDVIIGNKIIKENKKIDTNKQQDRTKGDNDFGIDLNIIADDEVTISTGENNNATQNAMDFILGM